jgi:hypothetical protein
MITSRMRWAGLVASMEIMRNTYRVLVKKPQGNRLFYCPRHRWEDNFKMDLE